MTSNKTAQSRMTRRSLLGALGAGLAAPLIPAPARAELEVPATGGRLDTLLGSIDPVIDIVNANTREHLALRFVERGDYDDRALNSLDWFFRDWRQDEGAVIDRRIYWALAAVAEHARSQGASGRITLVAGFRSPTTTRMLRAKGSGASSNSFHMQGRAADIQVEGMPADEVTGYARWLGFGGVGHYPRDGFTHIDSGPVRSWRG